jgi:hypothetical protein
MMCAPPRAYWGSQGRETLSEQIQDSGFRDLERIRRERGIPATAQRRVIYTALLGRHDHPTVEPIFNDICF